MDKGYLFPEGDTEIRWESTNGKWVIQGFKSPIGGETVWSIENFDAYIYEEPLFLENGNIVFNKPERIPKYVREEFLNMVEKRKAEGGMPKMAKIN